MATSMRPALATAASTARSTDASSVTSSSRTYIGSESLSASVRISEAFLALRPAGSRIVAKTVCPLRARVSANSLPKPVLEPVMRTTCLEFMIYPSLWGYRELTLMPEVKRLGTRTAIMRSTSDIPELTERFWQNAVRNPFYRPVKQQLTLRLDADIIAWLRRQGRGYQTRANALLRDAMLGELKPKGRNGRDRTRPKNPRHAGISQSRQAS